MLPLPAYEFAHVRISLSLYLLPCRCLKQEAPYPCVKARDADTLSTFCSCISAIMGFVSAVCAERWIVCVQLYYPPSTIVCVFV